MLEEKSFYLWNKETEDGHIGVKRVDLILKDGVEISRNYHRSVLSPGDDLDAIESVLAHKADAAEIIAIAKVAHTAEVVSKFRAKMDKATANEADKIAKANKK